MLRRDYILRMIEDCVAALRRTRGQIAAGQYNEAGEGLDEAFKRLIGTGPEAVAKLSETELLALLTSEGPTQILRDKTLLLVALLQEAGQLHAAQNRDSEARECWIKALDLLLNVSLQDADFELPDFVPRIDMLRDQLSDTDLPLRTLAALWRHHERIGAYGRAEDALASLLEAEPDNPALRAEAKAFYERLLRQPDSALDAGNLPRAEVTAALVGLNAKPEP